MNKLRMVLGIVIIVAFVALGICDLWLKKWDTSAISFLFATANGLIFFGH